MSAIRCFIANLSEYNSGRLVGKWVDMDEEIDWDELYEDIGIPCDDDGVPLTETFCPDWECEVPGLEYSEYPDYHELVWIASEWDELFEREQAAVVARMDCLNESFDEALEGKDDVGFYPECSNMEHVAREIVSNMPDFDEKNFWCRNFDYEQYGEELQTEGVFWYSDMMHCMCEITDW